MNSKRPGLPFSLINSPSFWKDTALNFVGAAITALNVTDTAILLLNGQTTLTVAALGNVELPIVIEGEVDAKELDIDLNITNVIFAILTKSLLFSIIFITFVVNNL